MFSVNLEPITLSIAVLGAILGIINTWHQIDSSRIKIRVRPKHAIPLGDQNKNIEFCIEITNLSAFSVTIEEAGILMTGTKTRLAYPNPVLIDGGSWPRRLEPRTSVTIYGEKPFAKSGSKLKCVYARTACGVTRKGASPAFKQLSKKR